MAKKKFRGKNDYTVYDVEIEKGLFAVCIPLQGFFHVFNISQEEFGICLIMCLLFKCAYATHMSIDYWNLALLF